MKYFKTFYLLLLLVPQFAIENTWGIETDGVTLMFESEIDVSNLFKSSTKVHYSDYGVPNEIAHPYRIKTVYSFPKNISSEIRITNIPEHLSCDEWRGCEMDPPQIQTSLNFNAPEMKVSWTLIDAIHNKVIGTITEQIELSLLNTSNHVEDFNQIETVTYLHRRQNGQFNAHIEFPLRPSISRSKMVLMFQEMYLFNTSLFEGFKLKLMKSEQNHFAINHYIIPNAILNKKYYLQYPILDADYDRFKFYLSVGQKNSALPVYFETLMSI